MKKVTVTEPVAPARSVSDSTSLSAARLLVIAATGAVALWAIKAVAIWTAGGLDRSPFEGPLFMAGLASLLIAMATFGVALTSGRKPWLRALAGLATLVVGYVLFTIVEDVVGARVPESAGWVGEEAGLWVAGVLVLLGSLVIARRAAVQSSR